MYKTPSGIIKLLGEEIGILVDLYNQHGNYPKDWLTSIFIVLLENRTNYNSINILAIHSAALEIHLDQTVFVCYPGYNEAFDKVRHNHLIKLFEYEKLDIRDMTSP